MARPDRPHRSTAFVALARALSGSTRAGEPGISERLRAVPRLITATTNGQYRGTSRSQLGLLALAVLYILSPIDLVPEALLGLFGLGDDALAVGWIAGRLLNETELFIRWEGSQPCAPAGPDVVPGSVVRD